MRFAQSADAEDAVRAGEDEGIRRHGERASRASAGGRGGGDRSLRGEADTGERKNRSTEGMRWRGNTGFQS